MDRSSLLLAVVLISAFVVPTRSRACKPIPQVEHVLDPSMQATDQTPPNLPALPPPTISRSDESDSGGCGSTCSPRGSIWIDAQATDDMTPPGGIGYRVTLAGGTLPAGLTLPAFALGNGLRLFWSDDESSGEAFDFTLQVVAIDLAGNESAPQTVRVHDDPPGLCAVARGGVSRSGRAALLVAALLLAARRRRRRTP